MPRSNIREHAWSKNGLVFCLLPTVQQTECWDGCSRRGYCVNNRKPSLFCQPEGSSVWRSWDLEYRMSRLPIFEDSFSQTARLRSLYRTCPLFWYSMRLPLSRPGKITTLTFALWEDDERESRRSGALGSPSAGIKPNGTLVILNSWMVRILFPHSGVFLNHEKRMASLWSPLMRIWCHLMRPKVYEHFNHVVVQVGPRFQVIL